MLRIAVLVVLAGGAAAGNWPQWRGPFFNGSSPETGLPEKLGEETLLWKTPLPGAGSSTPVVWDDRVFVSVRDAESYKLLAMCLRLQDGKVLWRREIGIGFNENERNDVSSPSPVTDGKRVYFYYGTGDLAAFSIKGQPLWSRNIQKEHGPFHILWIYSSSPLLYDGRLYIQVLHADYSYEGGDRRGSPADSYLLAVDPKTGEDLWKRVRESDARGESKESYGTPIPHELDGKVEILLVDGDYVTGHRSTTGKERWRCGGLNPSKRGNFRVIPSALAYDGMVYACGARGSLLLAIKAGGRGDVTASHLAWKSTKAAGDVCTPLLYRRRLYVLNDNKKKIYRLDPHTGEVQDETTLGGSAIFRASPTGADGKIYCMNKRGDIWVLAADDLRVLSQSSLGDGRNCRSTIVVAQGQVLVRTGKTLYAFSANAKR